MLLPLRVTRKGREHANTQGRQQVPDVGEIDEGKNATNREGQKIQRDAVDQNRETIGNHAQEDSHQEDSHQEEHGGASAGQLPQRGCKAHGHPEETGQEGEVRHGSPGRESGIHERRQDPKDHRSQTISASPARGRLR